jgi:hypothetical protein
MAVLKSGYVELGDPVDDLVVATILLIVGGRLVLLRPRKVRASPHSPSCFNQSNPPVRLARKKFDMTCKYLLTE